MMWSLFTKRSHSYRRKSIKDEDYTMPRKSKNTFSVEGDTIFISRPEWKELAYATIANIR